MAVDRQSGLDSPFPEEGPAADNDLFASVIRAYSFSRCVGELVRLFSNSSARAKYSLLPWSRIASLRQRTSKRWRTAGLLETNPSYVPCRSSQDSRSSHAIVSSPCISPGALVGIGWLIVLWLHCLGFLPAPRPQLSHYLNPAPRNIQALLVAHHLHRAGHFVGRIMPGGFRKRDQATFKQLVAVLVAEGAFRADRAYLRISNLRLINTHT
jgi:hypothetical protein